MQVPRSSKQIQEDSDYSLFSVVLFRRIVDTFKAEARQKGFQVGTSALASHGDPGNVLHMWQMEVSRPDPVMLGLQVREYEFDQELQELQQKSGAKLKEDVESKRSQLEQWSSTAYGEVFSHL